MFQTSIHTTDFNREFQAAWSATLAGAIEDLLASEGARLRQELAIQFATEGDHGGQPWKPRKLEARSERRPPNFRPLLVRTGRLRASLTEANHPEHVEQFQNGTLLCTSQAVQNWHQHPQK